MRMFPVTLICNLFFLSLSLPLLLRIALSAYYISFFSLSLSLSISLSLTLSLYFTLFLSLFLYIFPLLPRIYGRFCPGYYTKDDMTSCASNYRIPKQQLRIIKLLYRMIIFLESEFQYNEKLISCLKHFSILYKKF